MTTQQKKINAAKMALKRIRPGMCVGLGTGSTTNEFINLLGQEKQLLKNAFEKSDDEKTALDIWKDALSNVMPHVEVRSRRVGGATFQIPSPIRSDRKISIAMKWLINFSRKRNEKSMAQKLAAEIIAASKEEGSAVKKKVDTHKMAEANKAFSHFRF